MKAQRTTSPETPCARRILARAAARLGGEETLAQHLQITPTRLRRYLCGASPVPDLVLLRTVDIVLEELPALIGERRGRT